MKELTPQEQQRLWKNSVPPVRKIILWGKDEKENPCLLILYGQQKVEREVKTSSYYVNYLLEPLVVYTHYAVFHGINGHLPSIPNLYYDLNKDILCYKRGYKTARSHWDYDQKTRKYIYNLDIDEKYIIKEFYKTEQNIAFDYYNDTYNDYISYIKSNKINFEGIKIVENPGDLFGFYSDSRYYDIVVSMFSKERLYTRKKLLSQFTKMCPSVEEYERILKVSSVEWACGVFQELTEQKNPILLETAKNIKSSKTLWDKNEYNEGLKRFVKQYVSLFDEKLINEQKEFIYKTLPEMDFNIKVLKINGQTLKGKDLEEELISAYDYDRLKYYYVFGEQKLYDKNTYNDGKNVYNTKYKNTIQMAKAYDMPDVIGKIAYYIDTIRTISYFKGSGRTGAYNYYQRYIRRIIDGYKANNEEKFVMAMREMLSSYTDKDGKIYYGYRETYFSPETFLFNHYFIANDKKQKREIEELWERHIDDTLYIVKNTKAVPVHEIFYRIIKNLNSRHEFDNYDLKELIPLSQISYQKTADLFSKIMFQKLNALNSFDADVMLALMNSNTEALQNTAKKYFERTGGKLTPEYAANMLKLNTIDIWYSVLENSINRFTTQEYIDFISAVIEKCSYFDENHIEFSEQITELIKNSVTKLDAATAEEKQNVIKQFICLMTNNAKTTDFIYDIVEGVIFSTNYVVLRDILQNVDLEHSAIAEKYYNAVMLLKSVKYDVFPKDTVILSVLEMGSSILVKTLTEIIERLKNEISAKFTTMLLLFECNVYALNKIAQTVFESIETEKREKMHMLLIDSPIERTYQYGLKKLDDYYEDKTPKQFIYRMIEHPCVEVKAYISKKVEKALCDLKDADLYIYYVKTLIYMPNKVTKSKERIYNTIPEFLNYYPQKQKEIENILLDIGSTSNKTNSERALVTFAKIQKEVCGLCR